ncbi:MAG: hypothetical protein CVV02_17430 [Firmicutes bacterium HGW-Firmicutes-7]|nr:MAG: hypothetical protein CVV02_17430 [Firmicutes bacterium HGW-Firmicutes-7]
MKKINKSLFSLCLVLIFLITPVANISIAATTEIAKSDVLYETVTNQIVTSGLTYETKSKLTTLGWVDIHVLKMEIENEYTGLDILRSANGWGTKDTLTNMTQISPKIVGGINASFFDMSKTPTDIIGPEYNGDYASLQHNYNMSAKGAASLIETTANGMMIDFLGASLKVINAEGRELYISGINTITDFTNPIVINAIAMKNSAQIDGKAKLYKIVVNNDIVTDVAPPNRSVDIPENGYIITINETIAATHIQHYAIGQSVTLLVNNTLGRDDFELAISGGGKILQGGKVVTSAFVVEPSKRHPRSAVGITSDGKYLIAMVVDGRGKSIGATHTELANYLLEYQVSEAMHFDGGGSSELVARKEGDTKDSIMNKPSEGSERKIINGLGFVTNAPQGELYELGVKASAKRVFINTPITLNIYGIDQYHNPYTINTNEVIWSNQGVTGSWNKNVFTPTTAGKGKLTYQYNGVSQTLEIVSIDTYIDLDLEPNVLQLNAFESGKFKIIGTDSDGYKINMDPAAVTWNVADGSLGSFINGSFVATGKSGMTKITAQVGGKEVVVYATVGGEKSSLSSFEDITVKAAVYPETVETKVGLSSDQVSDGKKSIRLDYFMGVSDQTQAAYAVLDSVTINKKMQSLGLNIYGSNNRVMVRGKLVDAAGTAFNVTFSSDVDFTGWKYLEASIPSEAVYPVKVERIYAAAIKSTKALQGTLYFDGLMQIKSFNVDALKYDLKEIITDPLLTTQPSTDAYKISLFGSTAARNRLLDDVVLQKVYKNMEGSNLAIFAGNSNVAKGQMPANSIVWDNKYAVKDYEGVRILNLATGSGGLAKTDANQWRILAKDLANTVQNNIIIISNANPTKTGSFTDQREADLLKEVLTTYQNKTGKNIFYINASGYEFDVDYNQGIRYVDINGLWYNIGSGQKVDINNSFNMIEFYIKGNNLNYTINNIYPRVDISQ